MGDTYLNDDYVRLQSDVFYALLSRDTLANVNVVQFRKMIIQSEVNMKLVYLTARAGRSGAGIVVGMPEFTCDKPNVSGPPLEVAFECLVMEQPQINLSLTTGTLLSAELISKYVVETLHHLSVGYGALVAARNTITKAPEYQGVVAYRVHSLYTHGTNQTPRTNNVQIVNSGGNITLNCANDSGAPIFYTNDGSYPASTIGTNPQSHLYTAPFATPAAGTLLRSAAYAAGKIGSSAALLQL